MADARNHLIAVATVFAAIAASRAPIGAAENADPRPDAFAARLSRADAAMEYWDVTARFRSGERLFLRYLVTNEGPGTRTAAAAGHLVLSNGRIVPIQFGRTSGNWSLSPDRRRLKIASAVLDVTQSESRLEVDSDKHGIEIFLDFTRPSAVVLEAMNGTYSIEAIPPVAARGTVQLKDMEAAVAVEGSLALTHTWTDRSESEILLRRAELFTSMQRRSSYAVDLTTISGDHVSFLVEQQGAAVLPVEAHVDLDDSSLPAREAEYPMPVRWSVRAGVIRITARVESELVRWNPLDVIPRPFRWFMGLDTEPRRIWADAEAERVDEGNGSDRGAAIATITYAHPWKRD